jgi:hypothetical protein
MTGRVSGRGTGIMAWNDLEWITIKGKSVIDRENRVTGVVGYV